MGKRSTQEDVALGNNIRVRRMLLKISQSALGHALGLSFQQIQKYEKGNNRVGAVRLQEIATALSTTPAELMPTPAGEHSLGVKAAEKMDFVSLLASDQYAFDLATAFAQVEGGQRRALVVQLVQALAANPWQGAIAGAAKPE